MDAAGRPCRLRFDVRSGQIAQRDPLRSTLEVAADLEWGPPDPTAAALRNVTARSGRMWAQAWLAQGGRRSDSGICRAEFF